MTLGTCLFSYQLSIQMDQIMQIQQAIKEHPLYVIIAEHPIVQSIANTDLEQIPWKDVVLTFIVVSYIWDSYLEYNTNSNLRYRQYRKLKEKRIPKELDSIVKQDSFDKARKYGIDKAKYGFVKE